MAKEPILAQFLVNLEFLKPKRIESGPARGNFTTEGFGVGGGTRGDESFNYGGYLNNEYDFVNALIRYTEVTGDIAVREYSIPSAENFRDFLVSPLGGQYGHRGTGHAPLAWVQDIIHIAHPEFTLRQIGDMINNVIAAHEAEIKALPDAGKIRGLDEMAAIIAADPLMIANGFSDVAQLLPYLTAYGGGWDDAFPRIQEDLFVDDNQHPGGHSLVECMCLADKYGFPGASYRDKMRLIGAHQLVHEIPDAIGEITAALAIPGKLIPARQVGWPLINMMSLWEREVELGVDGDVELWRSGINDLVSMIRSIPPDRMGGTNHVATTLEGMARYREALADDSVSDWILALIEYWCTNQWSDDRGSFRYNRNSDLYIPNKDNGFMFFPMSYALQLAEIKGVSLPVTAAVFGKVDLYLETVRPKNERDFSSTYRGLRTYLMSASNLTAAAEDDTMQEIAMESILAVFGCNIMYRPGGGTGTAMRAIYRDDYELSSASLVERPLLPKSPTGAVQGSPTGVVGRKPLFVVRAKDLPIKIPQPNRDQIYYKGTIWNVVEAHRNGVGYDLVCRRSN